MYLLKYFVKKDLINKSRLINQEVIKKFEKIKQNNQKSIVKLTVFDDARRLVEGQWVLNIIERSFLACCS